jgi:hypothetical protein
VQAIPPTPAFIALSRNSAWLLLRALAKLVWERETYPQGVWPLPGARTQVRVSPRMRPSLQAVLVSGATPYEVLAGGNSIIYIPSTLPITQARGVSRPQYRQASAGPVLPLYVTLGLLNL